MEHCKCLDRPHRTLCLDRPYRTLEVSGQPSRNTVSVQTGLMEHCKCLDRPHRTLCLDRPYRTLKVSGQPSRNTVKFCRGRMEHCVWVWTGLADNTGTTTALHYLKVIELLALKEQNRSFRCCILTLSADCISCMARGHLHNAPSHPCDIMTVCRVVRLSS